MTIITSKFNSIPTALKTLNNGIIITINCKYLGANQASYTNLITCSMHWSFLLECAQDMMATQLKMATCKFYNFITQISLVT